MKRSLTAVGVTIALVGTAFTSPASAIAPTDDRTAAGEQRPNKPKPKKGKRTPAIVAPKPGQKVTSHTAQVIVQAPYGVRRATLNDTRLRGNEFTLHNDALRRSMKISSSHGLRHGSNTLRVTINKRYTGTVTKTVRFTVKGKRLLTGAGRDTRIVAGAGVTLKGTSRLHPTMRDRNTTTKWRIVAKPAGSKPVLLRANSKKPRLKTDLPGKYVVRATSSMGRSAASGSATTSDTAMVNAPESPMVPFNAWSGDAAGNLGISVGGRFYPDSLPLAQSSWQMLILDRSTLGVSPGDNRTYGRCGSGWCVATDGQGPSRPANITDDAKELGVGDLVVMVHRSQYGQDPRPNPFADAFNIPENTLPAGSESGALVLVPKKGVHTYMHDTAGKADLSGYMMRDRYANYTFVDDARVPFDTRSNQTCDANSCTVKVVVGDVTRSYTASGSQAGLAIMRFDRRTLATRDTQFFLTNGAFPDQIRGNMVATTNYVNGIGQDELVFITSVVAPGATLMGKPSPVFEQVTDEVRYVQADPARALGSAIARLGGSRHRVLQAGVQKDDGYTLIGYPGLGEGQGNENHAKQARFSGLLQRDSSQMFVPRNVVPGSERYDTFTEKVMDPPGQQAWEGEKDKAFMDVLSCLAKGKDGLSPANPRYSYWNPSKKISADEWDTWYTDVKRAQVSDCPGSDPDTFTRAKKTFQQELQWNYYLRSYVESLKQPYDAKAAVQALADTSTWSSELKASSDEVKNAGVKVDWFALFATAIEAVAPFLAGALESKTGRKLVEQAVHALSAATAGALEMGGASLETSESGEQYLEDDKFNVEVSKLGSEVVGRMSATADNLDRMGDVIASDPEKLSSIGTKLIECQDDKKANPPRTPGTDGFTCDPSFFTGEESTLRAAANASQGVKRTVYEKVLPLTYPVTYLPWDGEITEGEGRPEGNWDAAQFTCFNATPFLPDPTPPLTEEKKLSKDYWPPYAKPFLRRSLGQVIDQNYVYGLADNTDIRDLASIPQFDTYVIAQFGNNRFNVDTPRETIWTLFGEMEDTKEPDEGGLGADPVDFVLQQIAEGGVKGYPLGCGGFSDSNTTPAPLDR